MMWEVYEQKTNKKTPITSEISVECIKKKKKEKAYTMEAANSLM